jgi:uncharacterized protein (TIGR00251 family)
MTRFEVTVSPGASRSELVGRHGAGWKVRVSAPPERGRANDELVRLLADALGVPREHVRIAGGRGSRRKIVEVDGLAPAEIARSLG